MPFIKPMSCRNLPDDFNPRPGEYVAEEKFDGHRLIMEINSDVRAWSRYGRTRELPTHIITAARKLPHAVLDGELIVPGKHSYGVTELTEAENRVYVVFDVLTLLGKSVVSQTLMERRSYLEEIFRRRQDPAIILSTTHVINTVAQMEKLRDAVWKRGGEGLIVKRWAAPYTPGKRTADFLKIKQLRSAVCTVIGFVPGTSSIQNRGPFAKVALRDEHGVEFTVKTLNDAELAAFEKQAKPGRQHPALGRKLVIEYQEKTPDGNYRHPRWDHWEE